MSKTSVLVIPSGLDTLYFKNLQSGDRYYFPHVRVKRSAVSRPRKKRLKQISPLITLAPVWAGFDAPTKAAWEAAAVFSNMKGWHLFVQDTSARIKAGFSGYSTPNTLYQSMVGKIVVASPATSFKLLQLHPQSYYVYRKKTGTQSQYEPVLIQEDLTMPIDIAISYKSDLISAGGSPRARFYIIVYSSYQGRTIENLCEINFDLSHDWERLTSSISGVIGKFRGYTAFIEIFDARGTLLFDNVSIVHGAHNWARDPFCNHINTTFSKAFYQIPRNWDETELVAGASFSSVFHG